MVFDVDFASVPSNVIVGIHEWNDNAELTFFVIKSIYQVVILKNNYVKTGKLINSPILAKSLCGAA